MNVPEDLQESTPALVVELQPDHDLQEMVPIHAYGPFTSPVATKAFLQRLFSTVEPDEYDQRAFAIVLLDDVLSDLAQRGITITPDPDAGRLPNNDLTYIAALSQDVVFTATQSDFLNLVGYLPAEFRHTCENLSAGARLYYESE